MSKTTFISMESPFSNPDHKLLKRNICYGLLAVKDAALNYNEVSYAPHLLHTQLVYKGNHYYVDDAICKSDKLGDFFGVGRERILEMTNCVRKKADKIVFYTDFGMTNGMKFAEKFAIDNDIFIEKRKLPKEMLKLL
jgi:hypothetical protein